MQRVEAITGAAIARYIVRRQSEEKRPANGTINREVSVLMRALRLAVEQGRLSRLPIVHWLKEAAPRSGFFEVAAFEAVRARLPLDLQTAVSIAYELGWRTQSEVLTLELRQLYLDAGAIRLDPGSTKNDDGRIVYLTAPLVERLREHVERVQELARQTERVIPWLFPIFPGPHILPTLVGQRRKDYRKAWATACKAAGYPGAIRHDLRRTATRNLVNAGVPERVAMQVTGHKTRSVLDRYHIMSPTDLQSAAAKLETASRAALGTTMGTTGPVRELRPTRRA
jgi:integrase